MQLDKKMVKNLLSMNDAQLAALVQKIAAESGLSLSSVGINTESIQSLRNALQSATDADLTKYSAAYEEYRKVCQKGDPHQKGG